MHRAMFLLTISVYSRNNDCKNLYKERRGKNEHDCYANNSRNYFQDFHE